jgi:endonuclease YncB( thermonuclease family)
MIVAVSMPYFFESGHPIPERNSMASSLKTGLFLLSVTVASWHASAVGQAAEIVGRVRQVVTGSAFILCDGENCKNVRLCGIDTPPQGYPGWERSLMGLHTLVVNQTVRCVPLGEGTVCDGRTKNANSKGIIAQCFFGKDVDIAGVLVKRAFACDWARFSGGHYSANDPGAQCTPP